MHKGEGKLDIILQLVMTCKVHGYTRTCYIMNKKKIWMPIFERKFECLILQWKQDKCPSTATMLLAEKERKKRDTTFFLLKKGKRKRGYTTACIYTLRWGKIRYHCTIISYKVHSYTTYTRWCYIINRKQNSLPQFFGDI